MYQPEISWRKELKTNAKYIADKLELAIKPILLGNVDKEPLTEKVVLLEKLLNVPKRLFLLR